MFREYISWLGLFTTTKDVIYIIILIMYREVNY
jgi:hypothetical protein